MHDLQPTTALGASKPAHDVFPDISISENPDVALASVALRAPTADAHAALARWLAAPLPGPGTFAANGTRSALWTGADQWLIQTSLQKEELVADDIKALLGAQASVTEQSGAWACFDIRGPGRIALLERLTPLPIRRMQPCDGNRTRIEQLGCFVLCHKDAFSVLGPRASAPSLRHALITAAGAIS